MIINNFIEFAQLASDLQLNGLEAFNNYYDGYNKVCNCKPTLKQLYYDRCDEQYVIYLHKNYDHIKQKLILSNKDSQYIFLHLGNKEILRITL
jgi:hypothetical protein